MAAETERAGVKGLGPWIDKYHERVTLIIAILAFVISVYSLFDGRYTDRMNRSTEEVQRLYSTDFSDGLSELLVYSHEFIGQEGSSRLRTKQRYHEFWQDYGDDSGMLVVYSVLKSIVACQQSDRCDVETMYAYFPETIYQALFFLREFLFPDPTIVDAIYNEGIDGWDFGADGQRMLQDYCEWAVEERGGMGMWSPKLERLRTSRDELPDPCDFTAP